QPLDILFPADSRDASLTLIKKTLEGEHWKTVEIPILTKDGRILMVLWNSANVLDEDKKIISTIAQGMDITERKKMSVQIEASLIEKEALLKEVHHRVKNNLQIIASILNLQIRKIDEPTTIEALKDCQGRVRSMALVHEHLYRGKDLSHVDLGNYIRALGTVLFTSYDARERGARFELDIHDIYVDANTAIPLGLISNELITNSLKYAFKEKEDGKVSITATEDRATLIFVVADNGPGIPEHITLENQATLGLQLVSSLTDQLNGTVTIDRTAGTKFVITFPKPTGQKP
ncbi:MAG: histidine kinase dimerization/phosphoacceptor domain -containing protein, partial [Methanoregula sp.]